MWAPKMRSAPRPRIAAASTGNAISTRIDVTSVFHVKIGMRNIVMPGARIVMIVVMKFTAPRIVPKPLIGRGRASTGCRRCPARTSSTRVADRRTSRTTAAPCGVRKPATAIERAEAEQPVRERVESRERDVGRADLQRHEHVREAGEQRRREHQQHDRAVHREQLVVLLRGLHDLQPGLEQLRADDQGHHAADAEVDERGDQVQVPDDLVVGGGDPPDEDVALGLHPRRADGAAGTGAPGGGRLLSWWSLRCPTRCLLALCYWAGSGSGRTRQSPVCPSSASLSICSSYSAWETTWTLKSISEWYSPHSSAHLPRYVPSAPA